MCPVPVYEIRQLLCHYYLHFFTDYTLLYTVSFVGVFFSNYGVQLFFMDNIVYMKLKNTE